jgi:homoserine dehydrogenase
MVCFGQAVRVKDIPTQGIQDIDQVDFAYARRLDRTVRLVGAARRKSRGRLEMFVRPLMIPRASQLANVQGATNGIMLVGGKAGVTTLTGRGAGGEPTGVAVLSDVVEIARTLAAGGAGVTPLGYAHWRPARIVSPAEDIVGTYLRLVVRDRPGVLARVCAVLARHHINIDSVLQEPGMPKRHLPFVMTLEPTQEKQVAKAVEEISRLSFLAQKPVLMPFADLP